jgi:hypothetical protein
MGMLFVCPFIWSCTPFLYGTGNVLPVAGPQLAQGSGMGMPGSQGQGNTSGLANYLLSHSTGEKFLVAVPGSMDGAAGLILATGKPVMAIGGFSGSDQVLTVDSLSRMVRAGEIRFFSIPSMSANVSVPGTMHMTAGNSLLYTWVQDHCTAVPASDWGGISTDGSAATIVPAATTPHYTIVPDPMNGQAGPGSMNSLYDCARYTGQVVT